MPWFMRKDADHVQEIVAVEIKQDGESIGWVHPDVAAALVAGTMSPEQVAGAIGRALERNPRVLSVRWIDSAFIWLGQRFPALMDRILRRIYD